MLIGQSKKDVFDTEHAVWPAYKLAEAFAEEEDQAIPMSGLNPKPIVIQEDAVWTILQDSDTVESILGSGHPALGSIEEFNDLIDEIVDQNAMEHREVDDGISFRPYFASFVVYLSFDVMMGANTLQRIIDRMSGEDDRAIGIRKLRNLLTEIEFLWRNNEAKKAKRLCDTNFSETEAIMIEGYLSVFMGETTVIPDPTEPEDSDVLKNSIFDFYIFWKYYNSPTLDRIIAEKEKRKKSS